MSDYIRLYISLWYSCMIGFVESLPLFWLVLIILTCQKKTASPLLNWESIHSHLFRSNNTFFSDIFLVFIGFFSIRTIAKYEPSLKQMRVRWV